MEWLTITMSHIIVPLVVWAILLFVFMGMQFNDCFKHIGEALIKYSHKISSKPSKVISMLLAVITFMVFGVIFLQSLNKF